MAIFCGIGLPGFAVSFGIAVANFGAMIVSLAVIDKVYLLISVTNVTLFVKSI